MGRYTVSDRAASDLAAIEDGFLERGGAQRNADSLIQSFLDSFQNLADFPEIGTARDYLQEDELAIPHEGYIIVYMKRSAEHVDILHIVWGGMDLYSYFIDLEQ